MKVIDFSTHQFHHQDTKLTKGFLCIQKQLAVTLIFPTEFEAPHSHDRGANSKNYLGDILAFLVPLVVKFSDADGSAVLLSPLASVGGDRRV
jgi:hypothetical protein